MRSIALVSGLALVTACTVHISGGSGANTPTSTGTTSAPAPAPAPGPTTATATPTATATATPAPTSTGTATAGGVGGRAHMRGIRITPAAAPAGPATRGTEVVSAKGRLTVISGDIDFGTNVKYADSFSGTIFLLPPGTTTLPDLTTMTPALALYTRTFEVEPQDFKGLGAPGASLRTNDFAIHYEGFFSTKKAGAYHFDLASEDGARVYIDNKLLLDNDGVHVVTYKAADADLTAGTHLLRVDYFKGSNGKEVNLEIWVRTPDMAPGTATMFAPSL
ncbi:MAG TPA: PA14 domain-containing protein [Polyangiaceae bacterium]